MLLSVRWWWAEAGEDLGSQVIWADITLATDIALAWILLLREPEKPLPLPWLQTGLPCLD